MAQAPDQANVASIALIALGSNQPHRRFGRPLQTIQSVPPVLESAAGRITGKSRLFETPCFPAGAGPDYVNAALALETALTPNELLDVLHAIEADFGRERVQRWGERTLDLDLLAYGAQVLPNQQVFQRWRDLPPEDQIGATPDRLILPHPRLQDRAFVLTPLADVAPGWLHPVTGQSVAQMLADRPAAERAEILPLEAAF